MTLSAFKEKLANSPASIDFSDTIELIDSLYNFVPTQFTNGNTTNQANQNNGSCKLFAFAKLQGFSKDQTLACFGKYYTHDVCEKPEGTDHQNIRNFMVSSWEGIQFSGEALQPK